MHWCEVCGFPANKHDERCWVGGEEHRHWPALCCPGCGCLSFEEAHPDVPVEPQFPAGPNIGEQFVRPDGVYRWDGARWLSLAEWALRSDPPVGPQEATE